MVLPLHVAPFHCDILTFWNLEHVSWFCYSCDTEASMCNLLMWHTGAAEYHQAYEWTRSRWSSSDQFIATCISRSVSAEQPMGSLSLTSDPGLWPVPGVKMGSWAGPRGPWQTSGLLPQPHLNMNEIGICRNFMNVDTGNQSEFHWICLRLLPAVRRGAARNGRVQPSPPLGL